MKVNQAKKIVMIAENYRTVIVQNKKTMEEFLIWLSNLEEFLDIDKMRKIIYDEHIIDDMND